MEKFSGFAPLYDNNSKILVLGSFPSVKSRQQGFYFGNKQNRFWKTLCKAFGVDTVQTVGEKRQLCLSHGVALWDVVDSCTVKGSMDSDLRNVSLVDLSVFDGVPLKKILCNGQTSYKLTMSCYKGSVPVVKMPSTSPANVRFDEQVWLQQLKEE